MSTAPVDASPYVETPGPTNPGGLSLCPVPRRLAGGGGECKSQSACHSVTEGASRRPRRYLTRRGVSLLGEPDVLVAPGWRYSWSAPLPRANLGTQGA
jgi:hypothetical protein